MNFNRVNCIRSSLLIVSTLLFCGCPATALFSRKAMPDPAPDLPGSFSLSGEGEVSLCFWQEFGDEQLNALVSEALANNFTLKAAWDRLEQAHALAQQAGADLKPSLSATFDAARSKTYTDDPVSGDHSTVANDFSLGLAAGYELDLWGRVAVTARAAGFDFKEKEQDLRTAAITLAAEVADTWYALAGCYLQIDLLNEQVKTDRQYLQALQLRKRLRADTQIEDILRQERAIESIQAELIELNGEKETLRHSLAVLLGKAPGALPEVTGYCLPELKPMPKTGVPADLIRRRPDVLSSELALAAAHQRLRAAVADRFPAISISGTAETGSVKAEDLFSDWLARIAANVLAPLFDGSSRQSAVRQNAALTREAFHSYSQAVLGAVSEVENAVTDEVSQEGITGSIKRQLELAGQIERQVLQRYRNGAADYLLFLDERTTVQELEQNYVAARTQQVRDRIVLYRALAGGWDLRQDGIERSEREKKIEAYLRRYEK